MQLKYTYNSVFPGLKLRAPLPVYYHGANLKGFQGQEKDDEIKGAGNSVNYTYRMHDPRLGRFFAVDPLSENYAHYSPYAFSGNRIVDYIENKGKEPKPVNDYHQGDPPPWRIGNWTIWKGEYRKTHLGFKSNWHITRTKLTPVPVSTKKCTEIITTFYWTETTTTCEVDTRQMMKDNIGTSVLGGNVYREYESGAGDVVKWDTHGAPDGITITNLDSGEIIYQNNRLAVDEIPIPCGIKYSIQINATGSNTCYVDSQTDIIITTTTSIDYSSKTAMYVNGTLKDKRTKESTRENNTECSDENTCAEAKVEMSKERTEQKENKVECP